MCPVEKWHLSTIEMNVCACNALSEYSKGKYFCLFVCLGTLLRPLMSQVWHIVFFVSCVVSPFPFILNISMQVRLIVLFKCLSPLITKGTAQSMQTAEVNVSRSVQQPTFSYMLHCRSTCLPPLGSSVSVCQGFNYIYKLLISPNSLKEDWLFQFLCIRGLFLLENHWVWQWQGSRSLPAHFCCSLGSCWRHSSP